MMSLNERLDRAIRSAGVAIVGVTIGVEGDRSTWKVQPLESQGAAQPIIDAFTLPTAAELADEQAISDIDAKALKAVVIEIHAILPTPKPTLLQLRNAIIARYKAL